MMHHLNAHSSIALVASEANTANDTTTTVPAPAVTTAAII